MDLGLAGRSVLVTAASRGIGRATARLFLEEGARVTFCGRDPESLAAAEAELVDIGGERVQAVQADVSDPAAQAALVEAAENRFGPVEVLVNNAGGPPPGRHGDLDDTAWQGAFELTLQSAVRLTNRVLPGMKAAHWGRVVNISSYSVKQPIDNMMLSNSLRLAVLGWAKTLASEVAAEGILVNTVCPGWTDTGRVASLLAARSRTEGRPVDELRDAIAATVPIARLASAEEIARVIVFLASDAASYVSGVAVPVDGGVSRVL